ncbi:MAG: NAD-dependent epimerase/dehydratase family protein [Myxococcales bacterium]|nr:NAD-dependent epimerase/dehydratase family protein [Myxococcales bacterium]
MRVVVTGATGVVGRALCARLVAAGHDVRGLARPSASLDGMPAGVRMVRGDITVAETLPAVVESAQVVIHLAGVQTAARRSTFRRVNVDGTRNMLDACRGRDVERFVFLSSLSAQGPSAPGHPHVFAGGEHPTDGFGESKLAAEKLVAAASPGLRSTILRPAVVYGPSDPRLAAFGRLLKTRVAPLVPGLELSFLHRDDLCALIVQLTELPSAPLGPYFLSDGEPLSMERLVDLFERAGKGPPAVRLPLPAMLVERLARSVDRASTAAGIGGRVRRLARLLAAPGWACRPTLAEQQLGFRPQKRLEFELPAALEGH